MARKRHTAEEIIAKLPEAEVLCGQGRLIGDAIRAIGVTEVTYYPAERIRWSGAESGQADEGPGAGEHPAQAPGADLSLEKQVLKEIAPRNL